MNEGISFEVFVSKETFKYNAAHFVAFKGYRERLHGHNYKVGVRLLGKRKIGADGYLIDFGNVKTVVKAICKRLNEHFICPIHSDVMTITEENETVRLLCEDGSVFLFPANDCAMLPIVHATAEEMAIYLYAEILKGLNADYLLKRGIHTMEISVAEAIGQEAKFRLEIPDTSSHIDVKSFIMTGDVIPMPCPASNTQQTECCPGCSSQASLSQQLDKLAKAINNGTIQTKETITADDIKKFLN